ncbi:MAG: membrane-anchored protein YejM (alkaline phosphatase superfamily) [Candidatus Azotimanducaceae bacterium]|jgi:membrane-anchored protein YejM (alkaline phosphatase superfamily)
MRLYWAPDRPLTGYFMAAYLLNVIYGSYWESFLQENRSPVLFDQLLAQNYQVEMFTSASFTFPEFDQALFATPPGEHLHQFDNDMSPWQGDAANNGLVVGLLHERDEDQPSMVFMFYESTHARYDFPVTSVIRKPYLEDLNHATMPRDSLAEESDALFNRYMNSSYFIDEQLGRIYDALKEEGLWENTIVVVTGDHGEEFSLNGRSVRRW